MPDQFDADSFFSVHKSCTGLDQNISKRNGEYTINLAGDCEVNIIIQSLSKPVLEAFTDYIINGVKSLEKLTTEVENYKIKVFNLIDVIATMAMITSEMKGDMSNIVVDIIEKEEEDVSE